MGRWRLMILRPLALVLFARAWTTAARVDEPGRYAVEFIVYVAAAMLLDFAYMGRWFITCAETARITSGSVPLTGEGCDGG